MNRIAVIRIRGDSRIDYKRKDTMKKLRLLKVNHCSVIKDTPQYKGMLQKVKDYITWGEIKEPEMIKLLEKRGRLPGNKKLTNEYMKETTKYSTIEKFTKEFMEGKIELKDIPELKQYFRLNPPRGGYGTIKTQYANKGTLGYRGAAMDKLLDRMLR
ncbi:50S ribosomal protein L30 [archaeon]|nr:50S ribosomal protein L30 [archaeon]